MATRQFNKTTVPTSKVETADTLPLASAQANIAAALDTAPLSAQLAHLGSLPPFVIDRKDSFNATITGGNIGEEITYFLQNGSLMPLGTDNAEYKDQDELEERTPATIARDYFQERAFRRQQCPILLRYVEAMIADEARRNALEGVMVASTKDKRTTETASSTVDTINAYYDTYGPDNFLDMATDLAEAVNQNGNLMEVREMRLEYIREAISKQGGVTVAQQQERITRHLAERRAYYKAVQAFLNDPATWAQMDEQDAAAAVLDIASIAAAMRTARIPIHEDTANSEGGAA